jgi:hypothetical protein
LKDITKRREYDIHYISIRSKAARPRSTPETRPASSPLAQIAIIEQSKRERAAKWSRVQQALESEIFEFSSVRKRLEKEIRDLQDVAAAETAEKDWENSWTLYLMSPIFKRPQRTEEEILRRDRERQERRIQKDMKERRMQANKTSLTKKEAQLAAAREAFESADRGDAARIETLRRIIEMHSARERAERDRIEVERLEKLRKQAEEDRRRREVEAREEMLRRWREQREKSERKVETMRREADLRRFQPDAYDDWPGMNSASSSSCIHDGWWPKIQGRAACPECHDVWTYLLRCPSCPKMACPKCQSDLRPRGGRRGTARPAAPRHRERSPAPAAYGYDPYDYWD